MSSRARRFSAVPVDAFDWHGGPAPARPSAAVPVAHITHLPAEPLGDGPAAADPAAVERDAFAKGFAQGERAGLEAAATRADAMLRRLAQTIDDVQGVHAELLRRAERQVVELALAIARKVLTRDVQHDAELVAAMARVAVDRLADAATITIHLHPDDHAAVGARLDASAGLSVVADAGVRRGGCVVRSDAGAIDVSVDAQVDELTRVLLGDGDRPLIAVPSHARVGS